MEEPQTITMAKSLANVTVVLAEPDTSSTVGVMVKNDTDDDDDGSPVVLGVDAFHDSSLDDIVNLSEISNEPIIKNPGSGQMTHDDKKAEATENGSFLNTACDDEVFDHIERADALQCGPDEQVQTSQEVHASETPLNIKSSEVESSEVKNPSKESGMDNSQILYEPEPFAPRLPPDGHEFPNSWTDEEAKKEASSSKVYRSEYNLMNLIPSSGNTLESTPNRPCSPPPPPPPRSQPPHLDEENHEMLEHVTISSMQPLPVSTERKSSIEGRRKLFEVSTAPQTAESPSTPAKSSMNEPSRRSVKDKIAMFSTNSNVSSEDGISSTINCASSPSLSGNRSQQNGHNIRPLPDCSLQTNPFSLSKSSDHLPGISSVNLEPFTECSKESDSVTSDILNSQKLTKSTADLRQHQTSDPQFGEECQIEKEPGRSQTSNLFERSQSLLNVGQTHVSNSQPCIIEERRRGTMSRLRGLVIPNQADVAQNSISVMDLPAIYSKDAPLKPIPNLKPLHKPQILGPPIPMARKHVARAESLDGVAPSENNKVVQPVVKSLVSPQTSVSSTSFNDWKFSTSLPKYSPAFKRRSLSAYQAAVASPTMKSKVSANFKTTAVTSEPKSLESCTSPRSDSSFEYSSSTSDQPKIVGITTISSLKRIQSNVPISNTSITSPVKPNENNTKNESLKGGKGLIGQKGSNGRLVEDSDTDSAVSSSRSSISHELSPPNSPTPSKTLQQRQVQNTLPQNNQRYGSNDNHSMDATSTTEDSANNSDEGWRVLKPQSVEAINRKNILASAKYSNGFPVVEPVGDISNNDLQQGDHHGRGKYISHHTRRSDDEEASYADAETEDTESSCSELETGKSRKLSGPPVHHKNNSLMDQRPITDTEDDDDEEDPSKSRSFSEQHSQPPSVYQYTDNPPRSQVNESPLQAIYDMEAKMAYINEICDSLPCTRQASHQENRFFSRRESEASVIEHAIERKSSTSSSTITLTSSEYDLRMPNKTKASSNSSIDDVDYSNEHEDKPFGSRKNSLKGVADTTSTQTQFSRRNSGEDTSKVEVKVPSSVASNLEKKYSSSTTSVNLLTSTSTTNSLKRLDSPHDTSSSRLISSSLLSSTLESRVEKLIEKVEPVTTSSSKITPVSKPNIPRGRNDFKSLSEKWQQISSTASTATSSSVEYKTSSLSTNVSNSYSRKADEIPRSKLGESRERNPWVTSRRIETTPTTSGAVMTSSPITSSSTKRSVSVNDIRKAFEKAEMAVNTYGRDDNSNDNLINGKSSGKEIDSNSILSPPSAHFRVSSFDSTTSEDSCANTPGIYGSVSNLGSSSSSAQKDPYGSITSLASSTSLISPQELQQLIDEANQSLEEAGTPSHEVSVVILHREFAGGSLGITLAGGADYETKEITVHKVLSGSIADRDGRIHRGDRVLSINGKSTKGATHREALNLLKAPRQEVVLVVSRGRSSSSNGFQTIEETTATLDRAVEPLLNGSLASLLENDEDTKYHWGPMRTVCLVKDGAGLGFSLEGGKGSINGDKPLTIKKIFVGGPAEKSGALKVGDLIVSINEVNMSAKSRTEAWNFMKKLGDGEVKLTVKTPL